jgi:hypothetical protein
MPVFLRPFVTGMRTACDSRRALPTDESIAAVSPARRRQPGTSRLNSLAARAAYEARRAAGSAADVVITFGIDHNHKYKSADSVENPFEDPEFPLALGESRGTGPLREELRHKFYKFTVKDSRSRSRVLIDPHVMCHCEE